MTDSLAKLAVERDILFFLISIPFLLLVILCYWFFYLPFFFNKIPKDKFIGDGHDLRLLALVTLRGSSIICGHTLTTVPKFKCPCRGLHHSWATLPWVWTLLLLILSNRLDNIQLVVINWTVSNADHLGRRVPLPLGYKGGGL